MGSVRTTVAATALVLAGLGAPLLAPAAAHADQRDDAFISAIRNRGLSMDPKAAISLAHSTCDLLTNGGSINSALSHIRNATNWKDVDDLKKFGGVAIQAYCPSNAP